MSTKSIFNFLLFIFIVVGFYYIATGSVQGSQRSILIFVLLVLIFYIIYYSKLFDSSTDLVSNVTDADVHSTISKDNMDSYQNNYSYSIWFYIDDWNYKYGEPKVLLSRKDNLNGFNPLVYFDPTENNVSVLLSCYGSNPETPEENFICKVKNINLQKWVNLILVMNNRTLDVYINGKLTKTCILPGVPRVNNDADVQITPGNNPNNLDDNAGFNGYVSKMKFFSYDMTPQQAYDEYRKGFGGSLFGALLNNYNIKLSFYKNGQETNEWDLF